HATHHHRSGRVGQWARLPSVQGRRYDGRMRIDTLAIHAGQSPDPTTGAIIPPVYQTSTYVQESPGKHKGYEYARTQNPTRGCLEANIAALEGARFGVAFASGCAAAATAMHMLEAGDHVV